MPFFKDLKRRSKLIGAFDNSSRDSDHSNSTVLTTKSTSTLNSTNGAPNLNRTISAPNVMKLEEPDDVPPIPSRPSSIVQQSKRYSSAPSFVSSMSAAPKVPTSAYAPKILSISESSWVNQKVLLIYGQCGQDQRPLDGTLTIFHHQDSFPPTKWQVTDTYFKALVHLTPGPNELRLDFASVKLVGSNSPVPLHTSRFRINYLPVTNSPPLHLVILMAKDSPGTFDSPPEKAQREGNDVETAKKKLKMTGYLWSSFTAEQMYRHNFGRRSFRFDEEYQTGTLSYSDRETNQMRNEAKVHVIRSERTVAEIRDLDRAQQNPKATRVGDLCQFAADAVNDYFKPKQNQKIYAAVVILDSHWDTQARLVTGHAALAYQSSTIDLGIYGSHALHTYPTCIEEVVPSLTDCTKTDINYVAADGGDESGTWWQAACKSMGAHLRQIGRLLGCPHQVDGIMLDNYLSFNRTFITQEPYSTRTKQQGLRPCLPPNECVWHRLDALRFRSHPCFYMAHDAPINSEGGVLVWAIDQDRFVVTARCGISFLELKPVGYDFCESWIEFSDGSSDPITRTVTLTETELRSHLPSDRRSKKLKFEVHSFNQQRYAIEDVSKAAVKVKMSKGRHGYRGPTIGRNWWSEEDRQQILFDSVIEKKVLLTSVRIYHDEAVNGIEFIYEGEKSQLFGNRQGIEGGSEFTFDIRRGEALLGFYVRAGDWIEGLAVITSTGRKSPVYGKKTGGIAYNLIPPKGFSIAGVYGAVGQVVGGLSIIIMR